MAGVTLPPAYLNYLRRAGGGEGELGVEPGWIQFWPVEKVLELNHAYEIRQNLPGFFGFGSNGGGELLAFDMREAGDPPVVMVPFIPMSAEEAQLVATTFEELIRSLPNEANSGEAG
jgi:SMI1-KNR4 cell-wall